MSVTIEARPETTSADTPVLFYDPLTLGLNNQKLALYGLFCEARMRRLPLVLPDLADFKPAVGDHGRLSLETIYPVEGLHRLARAYGIAVVSKPAAATIAGADCFRLGAGRIAMEAQRGRAALDDLPCQFFRALRPALSQSPLLTALKARVFDEMKITAAVQLRIEKDWAHYAETTLAEVVGTPEDYAPGADAIVGKIVASLPQVGKTLYVVCDEADLPAPKESIRAAIRDTHGVTLVWKSDLVPHAELASLSTLEQAVVDFEMCMAAPAFIGLSRSTFSNMVSFEALCRRRRSATTHFIYNAPGPHLAQRHDDGACILPHQVNNRLLRRQALIPASVHDIAWPGVMMAHIAGHGDIATEGGTIPGVPGGVLVAGMRDGRGGAGLIEGIAITLPQGQAPLDYRARLPDGSWTSWQEAGTFVGSRAESRSLLGFAARLRGPLSLDFECLCIGSFRGRPDLVFARDGAACTTEEGLPLEALQLVFRRRAPELDG